MAGVAPDFITLADDDAVVIDGDEGELGKPAVATAELVHDAASCVFGCERGVDDGPDRGGVARPFGSDGHDIPARPRSVLRQRRPPRAGRPAAADGARPGGCTPRPSRATR